MSPAVRCAVALMRADGGLRALRLSTISNGVIARYAPLLTKPQQGQQAADPAPIVVRGRAVTRW